MSSLILASASRHRAKILDDAGLAFAQIPSELDERSIEAPLDKANVAAEERAQILAQAKALNVSESHTDHLVIGSDQILSFEGEVLHKCENMEQARRRLLNLSGKTHQLHSAVALARNGEIVWHHVTTCDMFVRRLSPEFIGRYLSDAGDGVLSSVGAYQIEGPGIQLFDSVEGDMFSIIGLPLLPLLQKLRELEEIDG